jgi:CIC family chloride channel protein
MVLHLVLGDDPLFRVAGYQLVKPSELGVYAVLGVVGGLGSVCFVKLLLGLRAWFMRLPKRTVWFQPVVGGLTVGLIGYFMPEVLGVGYNYVEKVLNGDIVLKVVVLLAVLKIVATAVCYASGNAGGIFGPALFIGAMMGAAVGGVAHTLFPASTAGPGAYALVGMGTAFAGIVRTPLTSVIMIFEMTRDYSIVVPLMISNLISFFISQRLQREPIYEALALQEGVYLPTGESREELAGIRVSEVMQTGVDPLPGDADMESAKRRLEQEKCHSWPVGERNSLRGVISDHQIEATSAAGTVFEIVTKNNDYPYVHADHPLSYALERMAAKSVDVVPVVSRADIHKMYGVVTLADILATYGVRGNDDSKA